MLETRSPEEGAANDEPANDEPKVTICVFVTICNYYCNLLTFCYYWCQVEEEEEEEEEEEDTSLQEEEEEEDTSLQLQLILDPAENNPRELLGEGESM